ncbi:hypothetical protein PGT21_014827 [Puccinia graminis f. sp. tritici]|uniref:Uncharacterized protein n=1 Tax=Puccinia graminis f. sp. tritici TaxID=56615 RepID=A0A5B0NC55_PUCGR|nr:hypothetical protein PGT21_014827 [Puccinia graminis f. sp. tritici]
MMDAVAQNPALLKNDEEFAARVKAECFKLVEANRPACGHDQSSTIKGKKGTKVCSQCVAAELAHVWQ